MQLTSRIRFGRRSPRHTAALLVCPSLNSHRSATLNTLAARYSLHFQTNNTHSHGVGSPLATPSTAHPLHPDRRLSPFKTHTLEASSCGLAQRNFKQGALDDVPG